MCTRFRSLGNFRTDTHISSVRPAPTLLPVYVTARLPCRLLHNHVFHPDRQICGNCLSTCRDYKTRNFLLYLQIRANRTGIPVKTMPPARYMFFYSFPCIPLLLFSYWLNLGTDSLVYFQKHVINLARMYQGFILLINTSSIFLRFLEYKT